MSHANDQDHIVEHSELTKEHFALIGFAASLGISITNDSDIADSLDVRKEAQLLMSLFSSTPPPAPEALIGEKGEVAESTSLPRIMNDQGRKRVHERSYRKKSFSFSCPSFSLKPTFNSSTVNERFTASPVTLKDNGDSVPPLNPPSIPADLFGRILKINDRDALRLSAEAMSRNNLQSYEKAIAWRIQTWIDSVARVLIHKRQTALKKLQEGESDDALEDLQNSAEAKLIKTLQRIASEIEVSDARTSFRVLPRRIVQTGPQKKRIRRMQQNENEYQVKHIMSYQTVLNLQTPAGYTEVTLQAPGTMEGTFLKTLSGNESLIGVDLKLDTHTFATAIERSTRIVVRSATEVGMLKEGKAAATKTRAAAAKKPVPTPERAGLFGSSANAAVITPRYESHPSSYCDMDDNAVAKGMQGVSFPYFDDFDENKRTPVRSRMVSPQPYSTPMASTMMSVRQPPSSSLPQPKATPPPRTPLQQHTPKMSSGPSLVSPNPTLWSREVSDKRTYFPLPVLPISVPEVREERKRILPALVQVACDAMRAA